MDLGGALTPPDGLAGLSDDAVGFVFDQYAATMAAAHAHLLAVIAEVGSREQMVCDDGARSVGAWVAARAGVRRATGEQWAAAAGRLAGLPVMWAAFAEGELSFDRVAPASQLATAETDEALTEQARIEGAATLARAAADARRVERHTRRREIDHLRLSENAEGTGGRIRGELFGDRFERVRNALEAEAARVPRNDDGSYVPGDQRMAVALDELASAAIAEEADPDRATVVIHADADRLRALDDGDAAGTALFGSGLLSDTETLRRVSCDCRAQLVAHDASGLPVAVGSPQRTAPHWLRRLLVRRDRWCTFPGCETTRHLHAHHIVHWADGGPTIVENLTNRQSVLFVLARCVSHAQAVAGEAKSAERVARAHVPRVVDEHRDGRRRVVAGAPVLGWPDVRVVRGEVHGSTSDWPGGRCLLRGSDPRWRPVDVGEPVRRTGVTRLAWTISAVAIGSPATSWVTSSCRRLRTEPAQT